ncbi:hypothetical protein [Methanobrevibacter sp. DSM 116169]|uniref:hypothetical protein n=1 Tax=Methanobrevibacter sp. DSM 116169 TaxID=3242727 RepID=UPI0038FCABDB
MDENPDKKIDLRIIVENLEIAETIAKSITHFDYEEKYNIIISSIIPTYNIEIVKNAANGADIILIGSYGYNNNYTLLFNELNNDFNNVEILNFENIDFNNLEIIESEIKNSIIKVGLSFSLNNLKIDSIKKSLEDVSIKNNDLLSENEKLLQENHKFKSDNIDLTGQISKLHSDLDEIKSEFSNFKSRFNDIRNKYILEIYNLDDLSMELFDGETIDNEKIVIATNKFKPEDIIVGQGFIGAKSKEIAIDWLKIVKTALIFLEDSEDELKNELGSNSSNIIETDDESQDNDSYDIPETFGNFWK